jgi:hypothetical protein
METPCVKRADVRFLHENHHRGSAKTAGQPDRTGSFFYDSLELVPAIFTPVFYAYVILGFIYSLLHGLNI